MTGLTFGELRAANTTSCQRWHSGGIEEWSVADWATATAGEFGEACNAIKKLRRIECGAQNINDPGRHLTERDQAIAAIGDELADTLIYLDLLARRLGVDLEAAIIRKFNITSERSV